MANGGYFYFKNCQSGFIHSSIFGKSLQKGAANAKKTATVDILFVGSLEVNND